MRLQFKRKLHPVIAASALWTLCSGADWPQFRGPNASGISEDTNLPIEFGPATNVVWKTALPPGNSSPAIAGDKIFVTAFEGDRLFTIALNRADGKILWRREAPRPRKQVIERQIGLMHERGIWVKPDD